MWSWGITITEYLWPFFPQENLVTFLLASLRIFGRLWGSMQIFPMIDSTGVTPWNCCCQWFFPCWALRRQVGVKWIWNRILPTFFLAEFVKNMSYMYTCCFFLQDMSTDCYHFFFGIRSFHLWNVDAHDLWSHRHGCMMQGPLDGPPYTL